MDIEKIITSRTVWRWMKIDQDLRPLMVHSPDGWVKSVRNRILSDYDKVHTTAHNMKERVEGLPRKEQAIITMRKNPEIAPLVFNLLEGKSIREMIWKKIKPKHETPFN